MGYLYGKEKIDAINAMPIGTKIHVEGVIGGSTVKNGAMFFKNNEWRIPVKYYDQGMEPGTEYNEYVNGIIVERV